MLDVIDQIRSLSEKGTRFSLCTVIQTWRSSPRPVGSCLVVTENGEMYGSVSGGCVENAAVSKALQVLETGQPEVAHFGVADEEAWEVGLSCGGAIEVLIAPFFGNSEEGKVVWSRLNENIGKAKGSVMITSLDDNEVTLLDETKSEHSLSQELIEQSLALLSQGRNAKLEVQGANYFVHTFPERPKMILIGSAHISVELIELAELYGFETIVIDPRDTFAKKTGYKTAPSQILVNWPQEVLPEMALDMNTYVVILSHDPKIDDEALKIVLNKPVRYIGALGSRKTHIKRVDRLKGYGFEQEELDRIKAPIGVDINSHTAPEIALSIMAEVVSFKNS